MIDIENPEASEEFEGKTARVLDIRTLEVGAEIQLGDWQIACNTPEGMKLITLDITEPERDSTGYEIKKGSWRITPKTGIQKVEFQNSVYYATETSVRLNKIFNVFKENIHVFDELGLKIKKRGVLLGSSPGTGKSSLINNFCSKLVSESDACVLFIDNENVDYEIVQGMFRRASLADASFVVLVIEDIGGSDLESRHHHVDSTLLNFLDGQEGIYKIPTLVIGTTNYLDKLQKSINSRPGRFDIVLEVQPPGELESIDFVQNFLKRELTSVEKQSVAGKKLTPAYLRECVIRHRLNSILFVEAVEEVLAQRALSESGSHAEGKIRGGLGFGGFEE